MIMTRSATETVAAPTQARIAALLARRTIAERRRLVAGITTGGFLLALLTTSLYASLGSEYGALLEEMPAALASMLGDADLGTLEGWLQAEVFSFMGPGLVIGSTIAVGSGALAGAENQGRLALIASGPVRRSTMVFATIVAVVFAGAATSTGLFVGILAGAAVAGISASIAHVLGASVMLFLLGLTIGSIAVLAGAISGKRATATATALLVAVASYCISSFFPLSDDLEPFAWLSLWHPFTAGQPLRNSLRATDVGVFVAAIALSLAAAVAAFERRDLRS